jgi:hypothetical protein
MLTLMCVFLNMRQKFKINLFVFMLDMESLIQRKRHGYVLELLYPAVCMEGMALRDWSCGEL